MFAEVSGLAMAGYLAVGVLAIFAGWVYSLRAKLPIACAKHGLQSNPYYVSFWGITNHQVQEMMTNRVSPWEYQRRIAEKLGWDAWGEGVLLGIRFLYITDPEDIKYVMKDAFQNFEKTSNFLKVFHVLLGDGIFNTNGSEWKHQRIAMSGMFSKRKLRDRMSTVFGTHAQALSHCFWKHAQDGTAVDAQKLFYCYTFDSMNRIAFNKEVDSLRGDEEDCAFQAAFDTVQKKIMSRFIQPWWPINRILGRGDEKMLADAMVVIEAYMKRVVDGYINDKGEVLEGVVLEDDSLVALLLEHGKMEGSTYTKKYLRDMILNSIIAGRDTTASAITSCIDFLCRNPEWQEKLHAEALAVFGGSVQEALTFDDIEGKSPLTEAVFMESIRLHPPVPMNEKRAVTDTTLPSGIKVKKGEHTAFGPYVVCRNPKVWGEDCTEWKPERWFGDKPKDYNDFMFPTFNCGPRLCLGKNMAILEAKIALLTLMAQYSFTMEPGFTPETDISVTWNLTHGMKVRVHAYEM